MFDELKCYGFKPIRKHQEVYHGVASALVIDDLLRGYLDEPLARNIGVTLGAHHGTFPGPRQTNEAGRWLGDGLWTDARSDILSMMLDLCAPNELKRPQGLPGPPFFILLAGLTSVADWIASNENCFPYQYDEGETDHIEKAMRHSRQALKMLGWIGWSPAREKESFQTVFGGYSPRPLQKAAIELSGQVEGSPGLVVIEAPTGEGKTEAAMYLADAWSCRLEQKGMYFGLPTMATSNEMFKRVIQFLGSRYPGDLVNVMLAHGHAALSAEFDTLKERFLAANVEDETDPSGSTVASEWFTYRKRGLLAPFGVGTVDQALMGVLQTRHVFVRLFGLSHKTVIIDEVHAYDAYMTRLLERLLEWLAALGSSVVLLSATLPQNRKNDLLNAYQRGLSGQSDNRSVLPIEPAPYPRISWVGPSGRGETGFETSECSRKELHISSVDGRLPAPEEEYRLGEQLAEALSGGGCAAVICNTVDRAQKVYRALKPYFSEQDSGDGSPELDLLHARFLYGERQEREMRSLDRFGKDKNKRPRRAVLVATQVIEQSLDLDFDLMVSEMSPVDLLLQRAGRLHRHQETKRPETLKSPSLWITGPEIKEDVSFFDNGTVAVYDYHILLRTWLALGGFTGKKPVMVPENVEELIEAVYGDLPSPDKLPEKLKEIWGESREELEKHIQYEQVEAKERWIKGPGYRQELWHICPDPREEDSPEFHKAHQALTRLSGTSVNILCLYSDGNGIYLDENHERSIETSERPSKEEVRELLERSVPVSRRGLVEKIINSGKRVSQAWQQEPLLRHHYLTCFNQNNEHLFGGYILRLNFETGLIFERMQEER